MRLPNPTLRFASMAAATLAGVSLFSCKVGPDYKRPGVEVPGGYKRASKQEKKQPRLGSHWWRIFNDPELNRLEDAALAANQDIKAAMARVTQARAAAEAVRSGFFPTITLDPSASRQRSTRIANGISQQRASTISDFSIPFDLSYEVDIWGRIRRSYEAAKATANASADDYEVVIQTATADVAQNYFNLRLFDAQADILHRSVGLFREQVELTQTQMKAGLAARTDVLQAQSQLDSTITQELEARRQRDDLEHALAILTGRPPSNFSVAVKVLSPTPPSVPAGLPSDLLRRRPDVAEAEENLISANAQIGVNVAAFFPNLTLTGQAGFESTDISKLLNWESRIWSIAASAAQPIFQGGRLTANLKQAKARYEELVATYRSTILGAFRDVENSLTDLHHRAIESDSQARAVAADRENYDLFTKQYKAGLTTYLQVITTERTLLTDEINEAQIRFNRMISTVLLIKALGGGWKE
jgi:multidrug efflux system outer membrane protein